ncbi:MAG: HDOD domain-containing protein [Polyangiaceae bacterium]
MQCAAVQSSSYATLRDELLSALRNSELALPRLSETVQRVCASASDDRFDARSFADLIRRDAGLAGEVLRVANSPLFAARSPISSLQQAVSRLGMRQVRDIAVIVSMRARVFHVRGFEAELRAMFRHGLATGLYAQEIARMRRLAVEDAFLAGLFHDVGKPVLLQAIVDHRSRAAQAVDGDPRTALALVDELHEVAGRALAVAWSLSPALTELIGRHHAIEVASTAEHVLRLADDLSHFTMENRLFDDAFFVEHPSAEALNLYEDDVQRLLAQRPAVMEAVSTL